MSSATDGAMATTMTDEGEAPGAQPKPMDIEVILEAAVDNDTAAKMGKARGNR